MSISKSRPPTLSRAKLHAALPHFGALKDKHNRWMQLRPASIIRNRFPYAHPVYNIRLTNLIAGQPLSATLRRVAWMYFLRDSENRLACAEVSVVKGLHKNVRLSEGPFVKKTIQLIAKLKNDPHIRRRRFQLRSIRVESLHFFSLWFKTTGRIEYFVPLTPLQPILSAGKWISRKQLVAALLPEARRVGEAHERVFSRFEKK